MQEIGGVVPDAALAQLVSALGVELTDGKGEDGQGDTEMKDAGSAGAGLKLNKSTKDGFNKVRTQVEKIVRDGYSATQILTQVSRSACSTAELGLTVLQSEAARPSHSRPSSSSTSQISHRTRSRRSRQVSK